MHIKYAQALGDDSVPQFDRSQMGELKDYLYHSDIHDAQIETFRYDREGRILTVETVNPIHNVRIDMIFKEVKVFLSISGNEFGRRETILSLTVEEDYSCLQNCAQVCGDCFDDSLYLLFQMFSGDELHIICEKVFIEKVKQ